jgi:CheY-like chemotaxis protein
MAATSDGPRIIVIDDDQDSREPFAMLLRMNGLRVDEFEAAEEALDSMANDLPAAVTVDITLAHGIDGYEAARRIRALPSAGGVRIVALTGYSSAVVEREGALFDAILTKPADPDEVLTLMRRFAEG